MKKPTIAVDIDDVLAAFAESFVEFSNKKWGTNLKPEDWTENWYKLWEIGLDEYHRRADYIYKSGFFGSPDHLPDAEPVLKYLTGNYRLVVVTSRHRAVTKDTVKWIDERFKGIFSEVHFAGIWDDIEKHPLERLKATKAEILQQIGADYLIDDNPKHCFAAAKVGIKALLFGEYRWTKIDSLPEGVTKVKNWQEVLNYFEK